ncbi:MAG TPA: hypothetical protein VH351_23500 [Bryobacteraceae bacterium]|jgi:hypothetical protein|nr:hypothetical protein [Bryobacteraceae bacterium]
MRKVHLICLGMILSLVASAEPHTNFSGRWRMLKDQSDFGTFSRPDIVVRVIEQGDRTLNLHTVETTGGKTNVADISYFTDGTESTNTRSGRKATSKLFWDGAALMIRTETTDSKDQQIDIVEHWELSPDGKQLITTSEISTPDGAAHLKMVCQKETGN